MPRFEFDDGKSQKFWEIEVEGATFTVRYGRIGTDGQSNTKSFDSVEKAAKEAEKVTKSKVKKGYQPVADVARAPEPGRNPELEAAVYAEPDNVDGWRVYADWLMREGDARGELIAAYAEGADTAALHEAHSKDWMGRFGGNLAPYVAIEWRLGFWHTLKVFLDHDSYDDMPESMSGLASVVGHALRHSSARFLSRLTLGLTEGAFDGEADWQTSIDAVVKNGVRPSVRHLFVGDFEYPDDTEISWTSIGTLKGVWAILPNLEILEVQGGSINLGPIEAPHLRELSLRTGGLPKEPAVRIGEAKLPALQKLEIWLGTDEYGGECAATDLAGILAGRGLPQVRWLGLMNGDFADDLAAAVARSPILPQLKVLDLSKGTMTDVGGQALLAQADKFTHLEVLNLDENHLSDSVVAQLKAALPRVTLADQKEIDDDWFYVSVGE